MSAGSAVEAQHEAKEPEVKADDAQTEIKDVEMKQEEEPRVSNKENKEIEPEPHVVQTEGDQSGNKQESSKVEANSKVEEKKQVETSTTEAYKKLWESLTADPAVRSDYDNFVFETLEKQRFQMNVKKSTPV